VPRGDHRSSRFPAENAPIRSWRGAAGTAPRLSQSRTAQRMGARSRSTFACAAMQEETPFFED
jgi:hypothetical protein